MDEEENERKIKKNVESVGNKAMTEIIVPTYFYLRLSLVHILLFMYFIYDVMYSSINKLLNKKYYHFLKKLDDINKNIIFNKIIILKVLFILLMQK